MSVQPRVLVEPPDGLIDERMSVRLEGLAPGAEVELHTRYIDAFGPWESMATFVVRDDGVVDLARQAPIRGSYRGIDPMGPVWSAEYSGEGAITRPDEVRVDVPVVVEFSARVDGIDVAAARVRRHFLAPTVVHRSIREDGIVGTLFEHVDGRPRPGLLVMGGSVPLIPEQMGASLAAHGFTVLAVAYFGIESLPAELGHIPLEYFANCAEFLLKQPTVTGPRVGFTGASKGGEAVPLAAAYFPHLFGAIVSQAASGYIGCGMQRDENNVLLSNWTLRGEPLPYIMPTDEAIAEYMDRPADEPASLVPVWESGMVDAEAIALAEVPVETADCPILYLNGGDDKMWPAHRMTAPSLRRLEAAGYPHEFEEAVFEGCGHWLRPPHAPTTVLWTKHAVSGRTNHYGGNPPANARASVESWSRLVDFFTRHLRK